MFKASSTLLAAAVFLISCGRGKDDSPTFKEETEPELTDIQTVQKNHTWYYFTEFDFHQTDLPQNAPSVSQKPWTESVRITSCNREFALVNHLGLITFCNDRIELFQDDAIFEGVTADSMVFSGSSPVFFLYRSAFFNKAFESGDKISANALLPSRPFLVEFDPGAKIFFPLVTYENLNITDDNEIVGYFWDGTTWACSAKKKENTGVNFTYFNWKSEIDITKLSPALARTSITFSPSDEDKYRKLSIPKTIDQAPDEAKELLDAIPQEFSYTITWKNNNGTSPVQYYKTGKTKTNLNANGALIPDSKFAAAVFEDGTTYLSWDSSEIAFKLPKLPAGYIYGDFCISGEWLYTAWEENVNYKTGRTGFIQVNLKELLDL